MTVDKLFLSHTSLLEPFIPILTDPSLPSNARAFLQKSVTRHLNFNPPQNRPFAPVDPEHISRVKTLENQVLRLSSLLEETRTKSISSLHSNVTTRVQLPNPEIPPVESETKEQPVINAIARENAEEVRDIVNRVEQVKKSVTSTKKRAANVRDVLRVINENVQLDEDTTKTIAEDWTLHFGDLSRKKRRVEPEDDTSPLIVKKLGNNNVFLPISPHITPRSKSRQQRRLRNPNGTPLPPIRQPTFDSPPQLPR